MIEVKAPQINEDRWSFRQILNEDFQQCRDLVIEGGGIQFGGCHCFGTDI